MTFANPQILWLLLALPPLLLAFFWWAGRKRRLLLTRFIQARLLPDLTVGISPTRERIRAGCLVLAVACLLLALARPQWGFDWEEVKLRGLDIVAADVVEVAPAYDKDGITAVLAAKVTRQVALLMAECRGARRRT